LYGLTENLLKICRLTAPTNLWKKVASKFWLDAGSEMLELYVESDTTGAVAVSINIVSHSKQKQACQATKPTLVHPEVAGSTSSAAYGACGG
jgi:hypothetical protein